MEQSVYDRLIADLKKVVPEYGTIDVVFTDTEGTKLTKRVARGNCGGFIAMCHNSRKHGYRLDLYYLHSLVDYVIRAKHQKPEEEVWRESWTKVWDRLAASDLWPDIKKNVGVALAVGLPKIKQAYDLERRYDTGTTWEERWQVNTEAVKQVDERLVSISEDGKAHINTEILWHMRYPARVKKMYFGKYGNDEKLQAIKTALETKAKFGTWGKASYDVSFEYNPDHNAAWYSEEYRGCGNGHYYLALDATHALFYEDD